MAHALTPTVGSLFSGYGGLDLAVEQMFAARTIWHVEYEAAPSAVLAQRWPGVANYGDITTVDWSLLERPYILTGGYPCQPFSPAGHRKGVNDERHLWPYVRTAIRELRPRYAVLENVAGHRSLGFDRVLGDLAEDGHNARWVSVRASDVGAPHRRERLFILVDCFTHTDGGELWDEQVAERGGGGAAVAGAYGLTRDAADAARVGRPEGLTESGGQFGRSDAPVGSGAVAATVDLVTADTGSETRFSGARLRARFAAGLGWGRPDDEHLPFDWGRYTNAVRRWETVVGVAPVPTQLSRIGTPQLAPQFVEWMMGLPRGWVTDVAVPVDDGDQFSLFGDTLRPPPVDLARNAELKMLGNGVCTLQAMLALERMGVVAP